MSDDDAVLVFSSGTTGLPKAVRHTHASLRAATRHWVDALDLSDDDRFQISTPPSHILGLLNLLAAFMAGATVRLHRRFDLDRELATIEEDRLTLEMAVAPIALAVAHHPSLEQFDLSSLRYIMWGATPVTPSVAETLTARTGVPILAAYGASEVPVLAVNPVGRPEEWRLDSPGCPPAEVELRVVDPATGDVLPTGSPGELEARSPSTMAGYLPTSADADAFHDGWYRTGDIASLDERGWVRLTDRAKDMIKVNGHQVAPAEIESVLLGHPGVQDCAVFGVPDPAPVRRRSPRSRSTRPSLSPTRRSGRWSRSSSPATSGCAASFGSRRSRVSRRARHSGASSEINGRRSTEPTARSRHDRDIDPRRAGRAGGDDDPCGARRDGRAAR